MSTVGVRELKTRLSYYLRRARQGERIVVTTRARPIAVLGPTASRPGGERVKQLLVKGLARWDGGKPLGSRRPAGVARGTVAGAVIADRR